MVENKSIETTKTSLLRAGVSPTESTQSTPTQYTPMYFNNATKAIANLNSKGKEADAITGTLTIITDNGAVIKVENPNDFNFALTLGINVAKVLFRGLKELTAQNNIDNTSRDYRVYFPLTEYLSKLNYKVTPQIKPGATPEEIEAEKKRANNALKDGRKKLRKDLASLASFKLNFSDYIITKSKNGKTKKEKKDYESMDIISTHGIKNGYIKMTFNPDFADALINRGTVADYSDTIYAIDPRKPNAFKLELAICEHFSIDHNHLKGTANSLKVKSLLSWTDLPSIAEVRASRKSWEERIKEPLENSLDELKRVGFLEDIVEEKTEPDGTVTIKTKVDAWRYSGKNGAILSDEEAIFTSYEEWENTIVYFNLKDAPDHSERTKKLKDKIAKEKKRKEKLEEAKYKAKGKEEARLEAEERKRKEEANTDQEPEGES